ncbi:Beta-(1,2)-xylosyltransferase [Parasponia andersonii]|uniref:Beta-(1,2)-xylosyltransferase n=1 Tax=Parasponia andersonii TaxID=3476 RepID=A0A2P5B3E9_PARAD|nr:Beta-(1,2)-xylosyltransferase [Parasponia andersonii]
MNRRNLRLVKIIFFLFALNSISLAIYFFSHSKPFSNLHTRNPNLHSLALNRLPSTENQPKLQTHQRFLKPWPILPSYLPWSSQAPEVGPRSCEAYFGNGFTRRVDLLRPETTGSGWFRCWFSGTLRSSVCEGGALRMVPEKVKMSKGGEKLEEVIGRSEEEELPDFDAGAFELDGGQRFSGEKRELASKEVLGELVPQGEVLRHTMRGLIESTRIVPAREFECDEWIEEPTLLVTRFEYANLFHTVTDWYSAYVSSRVTGLPNRPHLVFVDGHCTAILEETWKALFSSLRYAKNFSAPVCFRHAVLSPLGYETSLFKGLTEEINCRGTSAQDLWNNPDDRKTARLSEFGEMIRAAFQFPVNRHRIERPISGYNVLFVRREDYLAHPRHGGKVESRLSNEEEVFNSLKNWISNHRDCRINLVNGLFAHMPMKEQVRAIQDAHVIIGAHGAGLTHIVSAMPKTVVLEIISSQFRRPHFQLIAQWKGLEYHAINLDGSYANPQVVIQKLSNIMRSRGC